MKNNSHPQSLRDLLFVLAWLALAALDKYSIPYSEPGKTPMPRIEFSGNGQLALQECRLQLSLRQC